MALYMAVNMIVVFLLTAMIAVSGASRTVKAALWIVTALNVLSILELNGMVKL